MEKLGWPAAEPIDLDSDVDSFDTDQEEAADRREEGGAPIDYLAILRLASGRWREMGEGLRNAWKLRATDLNLMPLPGLLYSVPPELGGNNQIAFQDHVLTSSTF